MPVVRYCLLAALIWQVPAGIVSANDSPNRVVLAHENPKLDRALKEAQIFVETHTGLRFKSPVRIKMLSRPEFAKLGDQECDRNEKTLRRELAVLAPFGLFDSIDATAARVKSILSGASIGSYSPETKELRILDESDINMPCLVHELVHCVTDQHFDLTKLRASAAGDQDRGTGIHVLIEGTAKLAEFVYDDWYDTRNPEKAIPTRATLEKIRDRSLSEIRRVYRGRSADDRRFVVEADLYFAYVYGPAYLAGRAIREGGSWHAFHRSLFTKEHVPFSSREILALGQEPTEPSAGLALDLREIREWLKNNREWRLVSHDDLRLGEFYLRLWWRVSLDGPAGFLRDEGSDLGWKTDRLVSIESAASDAHLHPSAVLSTLFDTEEDAERAIRLHAANRLRSNDPDLIARMTFRKGRVVVFRVDGGCPDPLFDGMVAAVKRLEVPPAPANARILRRMLSDCRDQGGNDRWAALRDRLPSVKTDRTSFIDALASWVFLDRAPTALSETCDRSIEAGKQVASDAFRERLTAAERTRLRAAAIEACRSPETPPACIINALRFVRSDKAEPSAAERVLMAAAASRLGSGGERVASILRAGTSSGVASK